MRATLTAMTTEERHPLTRRLRAARELAGYTAITLGDELGPGMGRGVISRMEAGDYPITPVALQKWARACGVSVDWFFIDFAEVRLPEPLPAEPLEYLEDLDRRIQAVYKARRKASR